MYPFLLWECPIIGTVQHSKAEQLDLFFFFFFCICIITPLLNNVGLLSFFSSSRALELHHTLTSDFYRMSVFFFSSGVMQSHHTFYF